MNPADLAIAVICFVSFVVGVPANVISLRYFLKKNFYNSTCIYIAVASLDILTCVMVFPVGESNFKYKVYNFYTLTASSTFRQ